MAEAAIPVDVTNPGQVFACLGLMEVAEVLLGDAEGGFDWSDGDTRFGLSAAGDQDPVRAVLWFLAEAEMIRVCPAMARGVWPEDACPSLLFPAPMSALKKSDGKGLTANALPVRLSVGSEAIDASHWVDGTRSDTFKTFAGNQVGFDVFLEQRKLFLDMSAEDLDATSDDTFAVYNEKHLLPLSVKIFGFDARGAW